MGAIYSPVCVHVVLIHADRCPGAFGVLWEVFSGQLSPKSAKFGTMPVTWGGPNTHEETPDSDGPISAAIWSCKTPLKSMRALGVIWRCSLRTTKSRRVSFSLSGAEKRGKWRSFQLPGRCRGPWNKRRIPADTEPDTPFQHPGCHVCAMGNAHTKSHKGGCSQTPSMQRGL